MGQEWVSKGVVRSTAVMSYDSNFDSATVVVADLNEEAGKQTVEELKKISGSDR